MGSEYSGWTLALGTSLGVALTSAWFYRKIAKMKGEIEELHLPSRFSTFDFAMKKGGNGNVPFLRPNSEVNAILDEYQHHLRERTSHHLGYPYNLQFEHKQLEPFLKYSINNLGDPFVESNYGVHSRVFELEVLEFFAAIWGIEKDKFWGYTTTCGTEGNLLGILYGREKLPDGILYCSKDSHYSVPKAGRMFRMDTILIESQVSGEMNYEDLSNQLAKNKGRGALVSMNIGTTVKGAVDNLSSVNAALLANGYTRENSYVHCDGALAGLLLPFYEGSGQRAQQVNFNNGIDSISVSGHKMLGCPMPCGVVITRKEHMHRFCRSVEYLNSNDTTIMGSRNGQASLAMWLALQMKNGVVGLSKDVAVCYENAKFLLGLFLKANVSAMLNKYSTTVVFEKPSKELVTKWQLACVNDIAHVVVMPSSTPEKLETFFQEYMADVANTRVNGSSNTCTKRDLGNFCLCPACRTSTQ